MRSQRSKACLPAGFFSPPAPPRPPPPLQRWIAYQLLLALAQCHDRGVCHGDIKAENVALTSWDWAFLVDFAPYKPTLLPADNPADFSFFFDTTGRRKCCLAPERFYDPATARMTHQQAADAPLTPAMVGSLPSLRHGACCTSLAHAAECRPFPIPGRLLAWLCAGGGVPGRSTAV